MANVGRRLSKSNADRISLQTFGSATIVSDRAFGSVRNYMSPRDIVPMTNPFKYMLAKRGGVSNVEFLSPVSGCPIKEHFLGAPTYMGQLEDLARKYRETYAN